MFLGLGARRESFFPLTRAEAQEIEVRNAVTQQVEYAVDGRVLSSLDPGLPAYDDKVDPAAFVRPLPTTPGPR